MNVSILVPLAQELLGVVHRREVIEYGKLSTMFRDRYHYDLNPRFWGKPTGDLSGICMENGLPPISAVVVSRDTQRPGQGFFDFAGRHLQGAPVPESEWETFWQEQLQRVYACDQWDSLLGFVAEAGRKAKR